MFCPFSSGVPPRANVTQTDQQRTLNLKHLSEAVKTLTSPPVSTHYNYNNIMYTHVVANDKDRKLFIQYVSNRCGGVDYLLLQCKHIIWMTLIVSFIRIILSPYVHVITESCTLKEKPNLSYTCALTGTT